MISRIKALMVPLQPAQHLASGLAGQRVSVSVSQHPHPPPRDACVQGCEEGTVLLAKQNRTPGIPEGQRPPSTVLAKATALVQGGSRETSKSSRVSPCAYLEPTSASPGICMAACAPGEAQTLLGGTPL